MFVDDGLELGQVDVAFEGVFALRIVGLVDDHIDERSPGQFLVQPGGGEVHVPGDDIARLDEQPADDVLGGPALMGWDDVAVAVDVAHGVLEVVKATAAGVGFITEHEGGPLAVAHGAGAGVREQVDVDVLGSQQEGVVAGLLERCSPLREAEQAQPLHDLDLERFCP